jgi:hypothetical protein
MRSGRDVVFLPSRAMQRNLDAREALFRVCLLAVGSLLFAGACVDLTRPKALVSGGAQGGTTSKTTSSATAPGTGVPAVRQRTARTARQPVVRMERQWVARAARQGAGLAARAAQVALPRTPAVLPRVARGDERGWHSNQCDNRNRREHGTWRRCSSTRCASAEGGRHLG